MSDFPSLKELKTNGVKLLIFDLDGTLLDSMNVWNEVDIDFLGRYGYEVTPEYTDFVKRASIDKAAAYTQQRYRIPLSPEEIIAEWDKMVSGFYKNEVKLKPNVLPYLEEAKRLGFKLGIATDSGDDTGKVLTRQTDWSDFDRSTIEAALAGFRGKIRQTPGASVFFFQK